MWERGQKSMSTFTHILHTHLLISFSWPLNANTVLTAESTSSATAPALAYADCSLAVKLVNTYSDEKDLTVTPAEAKVLTTKHENNSIPYWKVRLKHPARGLQPGWREWASSLWWSRWQKMWRRWRNPGSAFPPCHQCPLGFYRHHCECKYNKSVQWSRWWEYFF